MRTHFETITRRRFLALMAGLAATALAGCTPATPQPPTAAPTVAPAASNSAPEAEGKPIVAVARCEDYGVERVEAVVRDLVAQCGGLGDIIKPGATVVIKPNFTAGGRTLTTDGLANILTYTTHPDVARAIAVLAKEAGAGRIILVEGWGLDVWEINGYDVWMKELGAEALDLDDPAPGKDFANVKVPNPLALDAIWLHEAIANADVLISVPKMKCHATCGITLSIKNIFGCTPLPKYQLKRSDTYRSAMHQGNLGDRLPRILVDILKIRPIDFAVVDAISTIDQGEGPWNDSASGIDIRTVRPHLLMAGRNPVALDAVGTAIMGFDATAADYTTPFNSSANHIAIAAQQGLGTNRLDEIEVRGLSIAEARFPFTACPRARLDSGQQMHTALMRARHSEA